MPLVGYICIYDHLLDGFYHFLIFMKLRNDFHMELVLQFRGRDLQQILDTPNQAQFWIQGFQLFDPLLSLKETSHVTL